MKRTIAVLAMGIAAGIAAHVTWFDTHRPCTGDQLTCQLAWIRSELKLTDAQYARIREIHMASSPRLLALAAQVAQMRDEYAAFERGRVTIGRVDFVEFARFVEQRRAIDQECKNLTRQLVDATSSTMSPVQRERYLRMLGPAVKNASNPLPE